MFMNLFLACLVVLTPTARVLGVDWASGDPVDIAEFGTPLADDRSIGIEWENIRKIYEVHLLLPGKCENVMAEKLRLEWWGSVWPDSEMDRRLPGWLRQDDHWNGQWVHVATRAVPGRQPGEWVFTFPPLTKKEWTRALPEDKYPERQLPTFRGTLKIRVVSEDQPLPEGSRLLMYGRSVWDEASFDINVSLNRDGYSAGRIEIINGKLLDMTKISAPCIASVQGTTWTAQGNANDLTGVRIRVLYAKNSDPYSNDLSRITVRLGSTPEANGFSFMPQYVLADGVIRLPDFGVVITKTGSDLDQTNEPGPSGSPWPKTVRLRIPDRPETSYASAMAGIPRLKQTLAQRIPIGVPSARQEFLIDPQGNWYMWRESLTTDARDTQRIPYRYNKPRKPGEPANLGTVFDTREEPRFDGKDRQQLKQYLQDDHLPLVHTEWRTGPIHYHHAQVATILLGDIGDDDNRRGDETAVLLSKLEITNKSDTPEPAAVYLRYSHDAPITLQKDGIIAINPGDKSAITKGLTALRGQISVTESTEEDLTGWTIKPATEADYSSILSWRATLAPGQTRTLCFKAPFVDLLDDQELKRLKEINYEDQVPKILAYWRRRLTEGMQISVPVPALNHLYAANLWHNIITTDRDPRTGLYNQFVGTWGYQVFANETVMIARSMDMRGQHGEAERFLEPMLHYQGTMGLTGHFSTKENVFHSAGPYTHGQYAMNHGFVLWGAADHYLFTHDRVYLERVAPKLIKGCDFIISERKSTMGKTGPSGSRIHGLAPACALEDIVEFKYWFATNGYFYLGMKRVAQALADIGHPQADRIAKEAESYRRDIEAALREATVRSAAVRLRNGCYIPYVPSHAFQWQHLTGGWVREALYCSLHAAATEVIPPDDPIITWMLDELEDNIFFSEVSGLGVKNVDKHWFELGAVTKQPCLLDTPIIYMARDEIPAALRSFWNTYALLIFPDVQALAEWAPKHGAPGGPLYKTSDESRFVMWLRQLLVWEDGDRLWLARATPRAWLEDGKTIRIENAPTYFGTVSLIIHSEVDQERIHATITPPARKSPRELWLRLRHPQKKMPIRVFINKRAIDPELIWGEDIRLPISDNQSSMPIEITAEYSN